MAKNLFNAKWLNRFAESILNTDRNILLSEYYGLPESFNIDIAKVFILAYRKERSRKYINIKKDRDAFFWAFAKFLYQLRRVDTLTLHNNKEFLIKIDKLLKKYPGNKKVEADVSCIKHHALITKFRYEV
jgi:hypothetical protein